jgi:hypothetical protein
MGVIPFDIELPKTVLEMLNFASVTPQRLHCQFKIKFQYQLSETFIGKIKFSNNVELFK